MEEPRRSRRVETREFWETAVRLWAESGLSVREFCHREGLTEHTFYSWRRELVLQNRAVETSQQPTGAEYRVVATDGRRQRRRRRLAESASENTSAVEFLPVRVVDDDDASRTHSATADVVQGTSPIEIVGPSPWCVRILGGFDPATLDAVLASLERRPC